jgi:hypothetical protein
LDVEGIGGALIGFPIGATMAPSAGMIVFFAFAAMGTSLVLCAGERSDSDPDLGAGLDTFPSRWLMLECLRRETNHHAEQPYYCKPAGIVIDTDVNGRRYLRTANMRIAARVRQHLGDTS